MLRDVFGVTDRDRWPALIREARAQTPPIEWATIVEATGYCKTHCWRLMTGRCR
jgi:hypothetical protein